MKLALAVALNWTAVVPVKPLPLIVTTVPTGPVEGLNPLITGGGMTVKLDTLVAFPPGVVTVIGPELVPTSTIAWI